jgi:tRNA-modifying protein YgfZ
VAAPCEWPGVEGMDLLGPDVTLPAGVVAATVSAYQALRIEAGVPALGAELTDRTIPAEAGVIERSVSFTKGCFTGQELVARIESRGGNVPRHLRGLVLEGGVVPPVGAEVQVDGATVGTITSAAASGRLDAPIALAYLGRAVDPPTSGVVVWTEGSSPARIQRLPLVGG